MLAAPHNKVGAEFLFSIDLSPDEPVRPGRADFTGLTDAELKMRKERGERRQ